MTMKITMKTRKRNGTDWKKDEDDKCKQVSSHLSKVPETSSRMLISVNQDGETVVGRILGGDRTATSPSTQVLTRSQSENSESQSRRRMENCSKRKESCTVDNNSESDNHSGGGVNESNKRTRDGANDFFSYNETSSSSSSSAVEHHSTRNENNGEKQESPCLVAFVDHAVDRWTPIIAGEKDIYSSGTVERNMHKFAGTELGRLAKGRNRKVTRKRRLTKREMSILSFSCYCYLSTQFHFSPINMNPSSNSNMFVTAFTVSLKSSITDGLPQKNKTCHGSTCHRPVPTSNSPGSTSTSVPATSPYVNNKKKNLHQDRKGSENFALRMASHQHTEMQLELEKLSHPEQQEQNDNSDHELLPMDETSLGGEAQILERRKFLHALVTATAVTSVTGANTSSAPQPANAFEKAYPQTLEFENDDTSINLESVREERIASQKSMVAKSRSDLKSNPFILRSTKDVLGSAVWGAALWFLLGSRSNPLVRPIANILYDTETEEGRWVKDRNEGLFAPLPIGFTFIMGIVFLLLGIVADRTLLFVAEGDSDVVLQLAGVSLIGGGALELGRIASGEKMLTRDDAERESELQEEFEEFASKRLIVGQGGSLHRSEVTRAFRRYYAKYRIENDEYPLNDLEIERLLRNWNKRMGSELNVSSAGFLKGVQINSQAEIR